MSAGLRRRAASVASVLALRAPYWQQSRRRRAARLLLLTAYLYAGVLLVILALENRFLFHPTPAAVDWMAPPPGLAVEDVDLTSADGTRLHAWWTAPRGWAPADGAMLYCHGNAGNLSYRGDALLTWRGRMGFAVLIFDYPGYGKSQGKPTEAGCYLAGDAAYDWLTKVKAVPPDRVILYGGSLGGAIATDLARRQPHRALVLVSTFTSVPDMAQKQFPWLPARWLVRNKLDNLAKIGTCGRPVFIAHGTADTLIPFRQAERLFAAACEPKQFFPMPGHSHNESPGPDFYEALRRFLDEHARLPPRAD